VRSGGRIGQVYREGKKKGKKLILAYNSPTYTRRMQLYLANGNCVTPGVFESKSPAVIGGPSGLSRPTLAPAFSVPFRRR
jgi:hypothetical protein